MNASSSRDLKSKVMIHDQNNFMFLITSFNVCCRKNCVLDTGITSIPELSNDRWLFVSHSIIRVGRPFFLLQFIHDTDSQALFMCSVSQTAANILRHYFLNPGVITLHRHIPITCAEVLGMCSIPIYNWEAMFKWTRFGALEILATSTSSVFRYSF